MGSDLSAVDWPVRTERLLLRPAGRTTPATGTRRRRSADGYGYALLRDEWSPARALG
jgi:hypothetical protein